MKLKVLFFLVVQSFSFYSYAQTNNQTDSNIIKLLNELTNDEFEISYNYIPQLHVIGSNANKLIGLGKKAGPYLYTILNNDENIFLIAHIILSHIYEKKKELFFKTIYLWEDETIEGHEYYFNNLSWIIKDDIYQVNNKTKEEIKKYWKAKTFKK